MLVKSRGIKTVTFGWGIAMHFIWLLLLMPSQNGTQVRTAASFPEIEALLHGGSTLSEAVITLTMPPTAHQLALFGD